MNILRIFVDFLTLRDEKLRTIKKGDRYMVDICTVLRVFASCASP